MNIFRKIAGKTIFITAVVISKILGFFIEVTDFIVTLVRGIRKLFVTIISMGGCLLFFLLGPYLFFALLTNPIALVIIIFFILFPLLGTKFISFLKYLRYMITEFLLDYSNYLLHGKNKKFSSFGEYGAHYNRAKEARRRKEQQERQYQQQKEWEERFRSWYQYQNSQKSQGSYDGYGQYYQNHQHPFTDPTSEFKKQYEKSCDLLEVDCNSDKYQIKLAYRKKAKQYHPDINKDPDATEHFKQINNAYEFLSDENIARYQRLK